jgi:hypothetical protein
MNDPDNKTFASKVVDAMRTPPSLFGKILGFGLIGFGILCLFGGGGVIALGIILGGVLSLKDEFRDY